MFSKAASVNEEQENILSLREPEKDQRGRFPIKFLLFP